MASSTNRWEEFRNGTLVPPVIVQHDTYDDGKHLLWVYTTTNKIVFLDRIGFPDGAESEVLAGAEALVAPEYEITMEDGTVVQI